MSHPGTAKSRPARKRQARVRSPRPRWRDPGWWLDLGLRVAAIGLFAYGMWAVAFNETPSLQNAARVGGDPWNYYAAGQRLDAGHRLYGPLLPGDLPVPGYPHSYPAPLLSPPLIAVIWRPLAMLPIEAATWAWFTVGLMATSLLVLWFAVRGRRPHLLILLGFLVVGLPLQYLLKAPAIHPGYESPVALGVLSGNVNVEITLLFVLAWWAMSRSVADEGSLEGHEYDEEAAVSGPPGLRPPEGLAGASTALAGALKLSPLAGLVWLLGLRAWGEVRGGLVALAVLALIGLVGAGLAANVDYVRLALGGTVTPTNLSLPGLASNWLHLSIRGHARFLPIIAIPVGLAATWLLRDHPRASFAAAIATSIWASPVVYPGNLMPLLAVAAPWDIPSRRRSNGQRGAGADHTTEAPDG